MNNPFSISFGKTPHTIIQRYSQIDTIYETFDQEEPSSQSFMITGVRGSGKTVALSNISSYYKAKPDWIVIELSIEDDLLTQFESKLSVITQIKKVHTKKELSFSAFGIGAAISKDDQTDLTTNISHMLDKLKRQNKRILVLIDEVINNQSVRLFTSYFQIFIRNEYPLYLIMTGLYDNLYDLQNNETLTFLYRTPKIILNPLSISAIATTYQQTLKISKEKAQTMAHLTKGYAFAFQVLGSLVFKNKEKPIEELLPEFDQILEDYVYEKIWSEFTQKEKTIIESMVKGNTKIKDIRESIGMSSSEMSVYRKRLHRKGVVDISTYGKMELILPRFQNIVQMWTYE